MTDCFLATVNSYDATTKIANVKPLVILKDGTETQTLDVKTIQGIKPSSGDTVLIVTSRNNTDDESISEYFEPSWANGRLIGVVSTNGSYTLKGEYVFESDVTFESNVTFKENVTFEKDAKFGVTEISFLLHTHISSAPGNPTGVPQ